MTDSGMIGGRPAFGSFIPKVKAFVGPLPEGRAGIEFTTDLEPDPGCPPGRAYWSEGGVGITVLEPNELVAIAVKIIKVQA
jgi:hypothetical protein